MMGKYGLWLAFIFLSLPLASLGQSRSWEVAVAGGAAHNFRTPLHIKQNDAADLKVNARYRTEPFHPPVYYDVRVSTWQNERGWELKFTHHKLILDNLPLQVQRFSITNGYNLLTLNRLWLVHGFTFSAGAGLVITHPESTIRGIPYPENKGIFNKGYYISGPTVEAAVADGEARLTNVALHGLLGVGFKIIP